MQSQFIKASLSSARTDLNEALARVTDEMLDSAPAIGMRTLKGQFIEILATERQLIDAVTGADKRSFSEIEHELMKVQTVKEIASHCENVRRETIALIDQLGEERLGEPVTLSKGFAAYLGLESVPAAELFRYVARHEAYHTGQIVSYLWARGDDPYKW